MLGGWSAAELLGASCGPAAAAAEIVVRARRRKQDGLVVRHEVLADDEITTCDGVLLTTSLRTAYDLARRPSVIEAVVAVDALGRVCGLSPADILLFANRHVGAHRRPRLPKIVSLADPQAGSPMETRIRLTIGGAGLPLPVLQYPVGPYALDLAYPGIRLGVEHNGRDHLTPARALHDLARAAYLGRMGWHVLRGAARDVRRRPWGLRRRCASSSSWRPAPAASLCTS